MDRTKDGIDLLNAINFLKKYYKKLTIMKDLNLPDIFKLIKLLLDVL